MSDVYTVMSPWDVEYLMVRFYRANGYPTAQSEMSEDRRAGALRVTRVGGDLENVGTQDVAQILTEVWDTDAVKSWDRAEALRVLTEAMGQHGELMGVQVDDLETQIPRTLDDELAPELHRHQFLTTIRLETSETEVELKG